MDETPSPASTSRTGSSSTSRNRRQIQPRHASEEDDGVGEPIKCTGKSCKSCTAGVVADCVAVCCCPCAVVDILAFTFLKIPYLMGRKCLTKGRSKMVKRKKRKERTSGKDCDQNSERGMVVMGGINGNSREVSLEIEEVALENDVVELRNDNFGAEEEDVWLELYKIGHLGFGRVSFSTSGSSSHRKITSM